MDFNIHIIKFDIHLQPDYDHIFTVLCGVCFF